MAKRKKSESVEHSGHPCNVPGCTNPGDFRAPRSRDNPRDFQWLCEDHIVEFNKRWDYFRGMNEDQIYAFQRDASYGHRPTWRIDQLGANPTAKLEEAFGRMFSDSPNYKANAKPINARDKEALATLDLEHPSDKAGIKKQYRALALKYHPDANGGSPAAAETFKKITRAYHHLMAHYAEK